MRLIPNSGQPTKHIVSSVLVFVLLCLLAWFMLLSQARSVIAKDLASASPTMPFATSGVADMSDGANQPGKAHLVTPVLGGCAISSFSQPAGSPTGVGSFPVSAAASDFNLDGRPDLAVANQESDNVTILLSNGNSGFSALTVGTGDAPVSLAVGDFNLDRKADLVVANALSNDVTVLLGNGSGGFSSSRVSAGGTPQSVTVGDFNLDSKPDLAVANNSSNDVTILLGNGSGGFSSPSTIGAGSNPISVAVSDFNLDGKPDLAVVNTLSDNVTILLGNGSGGFSNVSTVGAGSFPQLVAASDFNLDGKPDLVVANQESDNVTILLGNGSGSFIASTVGVGLEPVSVAVDDFNVDSKPDLAVANFGSDNVTILLGNGTGSFSGPSTIGAGSNPFSVAVSDFNLDGKPDLAVANFGSDNVTILLNTCTTRTAVELARSVLLAPYLGDGFTWGGKGWDSDERIFVETERIKLGYNYWNNELKKVEFGAGLDCSGLVFWAYNKAFGATKNPDKQNPVYYENADGQYRNNSDPVSESDLRAGDLLFFDRDSNGHIDHEAMYVGGDDVIEAFKPGVGIVLSKKSEMKSRPSFVGFRRRTSPRVNFQARTGSPVDLIVTDAEGFTISADTVIETDLEFLREVPGVLYYSEQDIDGDGERDAVVSAPTLKAGPYLIRVVPKRGASSAATYSLEVEAAGQIIALAQTVPVSEIPTQGYGIKSTGSEIIPFIPVVIDIEPGIFPNVINLKSRGVITVAVLSTQNFDATSVDPLSVRFGPAGAREIHKRGHINDINGDGRHDLVLHFDVDQTGIATGNVEAVLEGQSFGGQLIRGTDSVRVLH